MNACAAARLRSEASGLAIGRATGLSNGRLRAVQRLGWMSRPGAPAMVRLVAWLRDNLPPDSGDGRVVHGDFRCDNMIFAAKEPRVAAVLDWELSTLGDPAADFVYHLMMYRMPAGVFTGLKGLDFAGLGIPTEQQYVEQYCRRTGRGNLPHLDYLTVFVIFRLAAICHGIRGRLARGSASSSHAEATALTEPLAELIGNARHLRSPWGRDLS
jgi:aminoglycoside phosphotransferase (APT) family kinase protein